MFPSLLNSTDHLGTRAADWLCSSQSHRCAPLGQFSFFSQQVMQLNLRILLMPDKYSSTEEYHSSKQNLVWDSGWSRRKTKNSKKHLSLARVADAGHKAGGGVFPSILKAKAIGMHFTNILNDELFAFNLGGQRFCSFPYWVPPVCPILTPPGVSTRSHKLSTCRSPLDA